MSDQRESINKKYWAICIGILSLLYLINCLTPLRLSSDTIRYFRLLAITQGIWPAELGLQQDFLPPGYIYFLTILARLHLLNSFTICILQFLYLIGSLYFVRKLFPSTLSTGALIIFTLLNWTSLKFTVVALSEMQFLFFSMGALYFFQRYTDTREWKWVLSVILFSCILLLTRSAGVVLVLALIGTWLISHQSFIWQYIRHHKPVALTILALLITTGVLLFNNDHLVTYFNFFLSPFRKDPVAFLLNNITGHLIDSAEILINVPFGKTASLIDPAIGKWIFILIGLFFGVVIIRSLLNQTLRVPLVVRVYIVLYGLMIFNWPYFEGRFWYPVLLLLIAILLMQQEGSKFWKGVTLGIKGIYIVGGLFTIGYYTMLTFDKKKLSVKQDAGWWRPAYETYFFNKPFVDSSRNKEALFVLEHYNR